MNTSLEGDEEKADDVYFGYDSVDDNSKCRHVHRGNCMDAHRKQLLRKFRKKTGLSILCMHAWIRSTGIRKCM